MPRLKNKDVLEQFNSETPHQLIQECYEKEDGDEEALGWIVKLVNLVLKTESMQFIISCSGELGFDTEALRKMLNLIFQACYKEAELIPLLNPIELEHMHDSREISALVEIVKPLNKNVWE